MFSYSIRLLLASLVLANLFSPSLYAEGYIGEDLGTDLYRKVDQGFGSAKKALVGKRIIGSNARMNDAIKKRCKGVDQVNILKSGQEFTESELSEIESGGTGPVFKKLDPKIMGTGVNTELLACIQGVITTQYATIKSEAGREQRTLSSLG